ncbi:MAG: response regulator transcription factor [Clostridiales bacterium]|nr:response regulator transcription factor [Clostridiales bacterium]MDY4060988.1 response regulator transcription factor [Anaerovoracaceae bacterium]
MLIYCVEDNEDIRNTILYALKMAEYEGIGFSDGSEFFETLLRDRKPDLILLDLMLPGQDGMSILQSLRSNPLTQNIPVIITTAKNTEFDKVLGLDTGADDYLVKPFGMMELLSRIKAVLRRVSVPQPDLLTNGDISMSVSRHSVKVSGRDIELTLKEFQLLRLFLENKERVYSRDQLMSLVWGEAYVGESRTVDVHIGTLRTKLGSSGDAIKTVRGVGYRMEADK